MNYAVIKSGGKQYKVSSGDVILIEKILGESGTKVTFDEVIMMGEGKNIHVEASELKTASVIGEVIEQTRGSKIIVFKKKRRHNYRRKQGHKQDLTAVRIKTIELKKGAKKVEAETKNTNKVQNEKKKTPAKKVATKAKSSVKKDTNKDTKKVVKASGKKE